MPYINGRYVTQTEFGKIKKKHPHVYDGYSSTSGGFVSDLFKLDQLMNSVSSDTNSTSSDFSSSGGDFGGGGSSGDW